MCSFRVTGIFVDTGDTDHMIHLAHRYLLLISDLDVHRYLHTDEITFHLRSFQHLPQKKIRALGLCVFEGGGKQLGADLVYTWETEWLGGSVWVERWHIALTDAMTVLRGIVFLTSTPFWLICGALRLPDKTLPRASVSVGMVVGSTWCGKSTTMKRTALRICVKNRNKDGTYLNMLRCFFLTVRWSQCTLWSCAALALACTRGLGVDALQKFSWLRATVFR